MSPSDVDPAIQVVQVGLDYHVFALLCALGAVDLHVLSAATDGQNPKGATVTWRDCKESTVCISI